MANYRTIQMLENDSRSLVAGVAGLACVFLLTIPSISGGASHLRESKPQPNIYEDKDGVATEKSVAEYSTKIPKIFLSIFVFLGLGTSIALAVLETLAGIDVVESWLNVGQWVCKIIGFQFGCADKIFQFLIVTQTASILLVRDSVKRYTLGIYTAISSMFLLALLLFQDGIITEGTGHGGTFGTGEEISLRISQLALSALVAFSSVSLPRRPDVFLDGKLVDRMYSVSALGRYSFSWVRGMLALARTKNRLELDDLPKMDHYSRSKDLSEAWAESKHPRKLWIEIFLAHKWPFMIQWMLTLLSAFGNFAPQFTTFHLLQILERRHPGDPASPEAWVWVVALTLTTIGQALIESWLFW